MGENSLNRAVTIEQLYMCIMTITVRDKLYGKRAVRLRDASLGLGRWFGMLPSVPDGSLWVGG